MMMARLKNQYRQSVLNDLVWAVFFIAWFPVAAMSSELRIGIIGDQTGTKSFEESFAALREGVGILSGQHVAAVLHVGDMAESQEPDEVFLRQLNTAMDIMDRVGAPWYLTPGEHDVNPKGFEPVSNDRSVEALFQQEYAKRHPSVKEHLYYSFEVGDYHFIALYSHDNLHIDPRWGNSFLSKVSQKQLDWLESDLEKNKHRAGIVVFTHHPMWYNWTGWMPVHTLLKRYPVIAVIAGHFHYDQDEGYLDGIRYVVVGATGGDVKKASRNAGGAWHVSVLTLRDHSTDFKLLPLDSGESLALTPREDMDRLQALEVMLFGLFNFNQDNSIHLKHGRLVASCDSPEPAILRMLRIGNPIDVPIEVDLQFLSETVKLDEAQFSGDTCTTVQGGNRNS